MDAIPLGHDLDIPLLKVDEDDDGHMKLLRLVGIRDGVPVYEAYVTGAVE